MRDVVELRIEAVGGWQNPPYALTLCVIVKPGLIPTYPDDDQPSCPDDLATWLRTDTGDLPQASGAIANKLAKERTSSPSSGSVYWLWLSLAEAWAARCTPDVGKRSSEDAAKIRAAVSGIDADLVDEREFDLYRYRRSEQLDVDHLASDPPITKGRQRQHLPRDKDQVRRGISTTAQCPYSWPLRGVGLAVYRIVQEALTNTMRHAGPQASAEVRLRYHATGAEVEILDDGGRPGIRRAIDRRRATG